MVKYLIQKTQIIILKCRTRRIENLRDDLMSMARIYESYAEDAKIQANILGLELLKISGVIRHGRE